MEASSAEKPTTLTLDDLCLLIGRLYVQIEALRAQVAALTAQLAAQPTEKTAP